MFPQQMPHRAEKNACLSRGGQERPLGLTEKRGFSQDPRNKLASRCGWRKGRALLPEDKPEAAYWDSWTQNMATRATGRCGHQALGSGCQRRPPSEGPGLQSAGGVTRNPRLPPGPHPAPGFHRVSRLVRTLLLFILRQAFLSKTAGKKKKSRKYLGLLCTARLKTRFPSFPRGGDGSLCFAGGSGHF